MSHERHLGDTSPSANDLNFSDGSIRRWMPAGSTASQGRPGPYGTRALRGAQRAAYSAPGTQEPTIRDFRMVAARRGRAASRCWEAAAEQNDTQEALVQYVSILRDCFLRVALRPGAGKALVERWTRTRGSCSILSLCGTASCVSRGADAVLADVFDRACHFFLTAESTALDWSLSAGWTGDALHHGDSMNTTTNTLEPYAKLANVDLSGVDLSGVDLRSAYLKGANLSGANLTGAKLRGTVLRGANLKGANLTGADLFDANLGGADLRCANLTRAKLANSNLKRANLKDANLTGAIMRNADLRWSHGVNDLIGRLEAVPLG